MKSHRNLKLRKIWLSWGEQGRLHGGEENRHGEEKHARWGTSHWKTFRPKSMEICLENSEFSSWRQCRGWDESNRKEGFKCQARSLDCKAGEQWKSPAETNHAVENFIWQVGLGVKDRKGEMIQETIPTVQTTENENPNGVQGGREREREAVKTKGGGRYWRRCGIKW